jgi:hypothetical protein
MALTRGSGPAYLHRHISTCADAVLANRRGRENLGPDLPLLVRGYLDARAPVAALSGGSHPVGPQLVSHSARRDRPPAPEMAAEAADRPCVVSRLDLFVAAGSGRELSSSAGSAAAPRRGGWRCLIRETPRRHERELFSPKLVAVRSDPRARRRTPHRGHPDVEARWLAPVRRSARYQIRRFFRWVGQLRSAILSIGGRRRRRRTSRAQQTVSGQRLASIPGAAAFSRPAGEFQRIIVGRTSAASSVPPHCEISWPSPANTTASGDFGGRYTVTCRPSS